MTIIAAIDWYVATDPDAGDGPDLAYRWGKEDATEGNAKADGYFPIDSPAWISYNEGYAAGEKIRKQMAPPSELDEIEFLTQASDAFRSGRTELVAIMTDSLFDEIEDEWIGHAFSTEPYNY